MISYLKYLALIAMLIFVSVKIYRYQQAKDALPDRTLLIQANVELKLEKYAAEIRNKCNNEILEEAQKLADSIAFVKANSLMLFDTLIRPPKPGKPQVPERLPLQDSLDVVPLIPIDSSVLNNQY